MRQTRIPLDYCVFMFITLRTSTMRVLLFASFILATAVTPQDLDKLDSEVENEETFVYSTCKALVVGQFE